ncbi:MAG: MarR family transcriptional regulator [Prolixibacteraceae bacterium]|nr:MarR family transcriptional regulator [Prolixibacteraceae bacterium]
MEFEQLKLDNQLCFPIYAASRLITREYQPHLDKLGITYPQYLVLMVLWEHENLTVNEISKKLILNTNTITPLLKRMEAMQLIVRQRSDNDERKVLITLTDQGRNMQIDAAEIPEKLVASIGENIDIQELIHLKDRLHQIIHHLQKK